MKYLNPECNRGIGLVAYQRDWFSKRRHCSTHCRDAFVADAPNLLKRFVVAFVARFVIACVAFVGLITMAVLAAPPARQDAPHLPGCDRNLADASAGVAAMQARIKSLSGVDSSEICKATQLYFLEVVKARAVTALCKSGTERERDLGRFDADVAHANEVIAARTSDRKCRGCRVVVLPQRLDANGMDMAQEIEPKFLASATGRAPRQREKDA